MLKRIVGIITAAVIALPVASPIFAQAAQSSASTDMKSVAEALVNAEVDYERYFDAYVDDYWLKVDIETKTAEITDFYTNGYDMVIPSEFEDVEYDWGYDEDWNLVEYIDDFTVVAYSAEYIWIDSIEIPDSIVYIKDKTLGYYGDDVTDMKILGKEGSAAIEYASENGLNYETLYDISIAQLNVLSESFTYTGDEIYTDVTVTIGEYALTEGVDYYLTYENNVNAGTATVIATGIGNYRGEIFGSFEITPLAVDAEQLVIEIPESAVYNKDGAFDEIKVTYNGIELSAGDDFIVANLSDKIGNVTGTLTLVGNYNGEKEIALNIVMGKISKLYARGIDTKTAKTSWTDAGCDEYIIYRYKNGTYVEIARTNDTCYFDSSLVQFGAFYYKVKGVVYSNDGTEYLTPFTNMAYAVTKGATPKLKLATKNNAVTVTWSKNSRAQGYKIYRSTNGYSWSLVKKITKGTTTSYTDKTAENDVGYYYKVCAYRVVRGKAFYTPYSEIQYSLDYDSILNAANASSRIYKFEVENAQKSKSTYSSYTISSRDKAVLAKFAREHFTSDMTRAEKLMITLKWIHENVDYATTSAKWNKIAGKSYVDAIFTYKTGQCAQYNGAMAAMMSYMGYDVTLVQGWRGTWNTNYWQHFWVEVHIGGRDYLVETGNLGRSGNWWFFLEQYEYAGGYIKNCKNL